MFEKPENYQPFIVSKGELAKRWPRELTEEEKSELGMEEKSAKEKESRESISSVLRTSWKNPENKNEREIEIDIQKEIQFFEKLYKDNLGIKIDQKEVMSVWNRNFESMKKEIEIYGYDTIIIVPDNVLPEAFFNQQMVETMDEGSGKGKINKTYQSNNFQEGGAFAGLKNSGKQTYRIILTKGEQNMNETADPLLKATLKKSIEGLTGLSKQEIKDRIQKGGELPINFKENIGGKEMEIKAEGMSLPEYMVFQRAYFEKTGQHLDENGGTWLPKSFSGSRVVCASWVSGDRRLFVYAFDPDDSDGFLGLRLSRSFS